MIVITLSKVPNKLRGDLTKWFSEIQTGVFVGNVSARIRDLLWTRVLENIGQGEATMVFNAYNELGYDFRTTRTDHAVVDYDGIPLMLRVTNAGQTQTGFSNASKWHQAGRFGRKQRAAPIAAAIPIAMVALDLETTGTEAEQNQIIAMGAVKREADGTQTDFYRLINIEGVVPKEISALTGLSTPILHSEGVGLGEALAQLTDFVGLLPVIGYNLRFDMGFILAAQHQLGKPEWPNKLVDLLPRVKKANPFLDNYRLGTVLKAYDLKNDHPHHALADAKATLALADKVIKKL